MIEYLEVEQARDLAGLRLVLTRGVPNPWGETAKGFFHVKRIPFVAVSQYPGEPNAALQAWTGQNSGPAAVYRDEPPKVSWGPILHLAERIEREPPLLPAACDDRVRMLGLCEELAGEDGLGWHRRRHSMCAWPAPDETETVGILPAANAARIRRKYAGSDAPGIAEASITRMLQIVGAMAEQAENARAAGRRYLIGDRLSALDIMWAGFCGIFIPIPDAICAISPEVRTLYTIEEARIRAAFTPGLLDHRDFMYTHHLMPPIRL